MNELILEKYFKDGKKQIEIAKELNISKYKVSRVVSKDVRYLQEKEKRKSHNKKKNVDFTKEYIYSTRRYNNNDVDYAILKHAHELASRELSDSNRTINNRVYRNWNSSIYKYNEKTKTYYLKHGINVGADVPKKVNWKV